MNPTLKQYLPSIGSVVVVAVTVLAGALTDERITIAEVVVIAIATLTAFATYIVPNTPQLPWLKTVVTAVLAGVNALQGVLTDGLKPSELLLVLVAGLGAIGVVAGTNRFAPVHAPVVAGAAAAVNEGRTYGTDVTTGGGNGTNAEWTGLPPEGGSTYRERGAVDSNLIWTVVGVLLVIALVIWIVRST